MSTEPSVDALSTTTTSGGDPALVSRSAERTQRRSRGPALKFTTTTAQSAVDAVGGGGDADADASVTA
jgi:hypothetical protein